jgi:iron(III) transport system permease protein
MAAVTAAEPRRLGEWGGKIVIALCVGLTVYLALIPLGFLVWQSFFSPQTAEKAARFTFGNYLEAYGSSETFRLFWTSVRYALGTSMFSFIVGTGHAWMN